MSDGGIIWHTKENPKKDGFYLVTTKTGMTRMGRYYADYNRWELVSVVAWAEMPSPYVPNKN